jgi:tryptophan synthase alpha chain
MITRLETAFRERHGTGGVLPYLTAGFPSLSVTRELILRCDALGAAVIELGFPYSDSIADGPVIHTSFHEALRGGFRVSDAFDLVRGVRSQVRCPIVAMSSFSLVQRIGPDAFIGRAADAGFDGVIFPDLPVEEGNAVRASARARDMAAIALVAPTTPPPRREQIARVADGFIYRMAVSGITGERGELPVGLGEEVDVLRRISGLPVCVGFGISTIAQVREICRISDGAIVGSAIVRRMHRAVRSGKSDREVVDAAAKFIGALIKGASAGV